jgi:hypothetical protein
MMICEKHLREFMDAYIEYCYDNLNYLFHNSTDIHVADSDSSYF